MGLVIFKRFTCSTIINIYSLIGIMLLVEKSSPLLIYSNLRREDTPPQKINIILSILHVYNIKHRILLSILYENSFVIYIYKFIILRHTSRLYQG